MGIYTNFADNLRRECFRYPSISAVCAGAGINRQQFNKYLAGKSLPNTKTLDRICQFIGVSEEELFVSNPPPSPPLADSIVPSSKRWLGAPLASLASALDKLTNGAISIGATAIRPGLYSCYFPLEGTSHHLMSSLVIVRRLTFGLVFTRLTVFPSKDRSVKFIAKSRHDGFVLANEREVFLVGINRAHPEQLSFISFERASGQIRDLYTGLSIIRTSQDAMAARVCLRYRGDSVDYRRAIQSIGPIHMQCDGLDPLVRSAMFDVDVDRPNHLLGLTFAETMVRALHNTSL